RRCDGSDTSKCAGYTPADTTCAVATCASGTSTASSKCDGSGVCAAGAATPCAGYACDAAGASCKTMCATNGDCTNGYVCVSNACVPQSTSCTADGLSTITNDGQTSSCAPFKCKGGRCPTSCATTQDCTSGLICDSASGACIADTGGTSSGGGCALASSRSSSGSTSSALGVVAIAALALAARRRRRS
ncbi:MAG: hypothetical protein ACHREM_26735, partial [Polyangiales bacterium]